MIPGEAISAIAGLAGVATRPDAGGRLASLAGAEALLVLVRDAGLGTLVPAIGFPKTLPGGARWRTFLAAAQRESPHAGIVDFPTAVRQVPACAWTVGSATFVFVGAGCQRDRVEGLLPLLPPVSALFAAEQDAAVARGELRAAQDHARQAEALAAALDAARADVSRSMSEVNRQTAELLEARERAEDAARAKDEFLAMLGHELRNPLAPITTALQLLRLRNIHSREQDVIERQITNIMRLIDDLMDISRITRGRVELRRQVLELGAIVSEAIEIASGELERKRQQLRVDVPALGLLVDGDATRLTQVVTNLVTNASKYSDPGSEITVTAAQIDGMVRLAVRDRGIGLPESMLARVFELFVQTPQAVDRAQGGLGLGLAIVRSLVSLHGGRVWAESEGPGLGSTFVVELPLAADAALPLAARRDSRAHLCPVPRREERILVVDDNDDARLVLSEALTALGYAVSTAPDGPAALVIAETFNPDVALLDIGLPVMDGYELASHLRQRTPPPRLVAVTGYGQESDRQRAQDAGFDAHLVKPLVLEDLMRILETFKAGESEHHPQPADAGSSISVQ